MLLETHEETIVDVREDQLAGVVERLTDPAKAFVVLDEALRHGSYKIAKK